MMTSRSRWRSANGSSTLIRPAIATLSRCRTLVSSIPSPFLRQSRSTPHITGLDLVDRLRSTGVAIPIMLITGWSSSLALVAHVAELGIDKVLEKPPEERELLAFIDAANPRLAVLAGRQVVGSVGPVSLNQAASGMPSTRHPAGANLQQKCRG
jgi:hypothetical protein